MTGAKPSVTRAAQRLGLTVRARRFAPCPKCGANEPVRISADDTRWTCPTCNERDDAYALVMSHRGCKFHDAKALLQESLNAAANRPGMASECRTPERCGRMGYLPEPPPSLVERAELAASQGVAPYKYGGDQVLLEGQRVCCPVLVVTAVRSCPVPRHDAICLAWRRSGRWRAAWLPRGSALTRRGLMHHQRIGLPVHRGNVDAVIDLISAWEASLLRVGSGA